MSKITWQPDVKYAIRGRIVTLDSNSTVIDDGIIYIEGDLIRFVQASDEDAPTGWQKSKAINTSGTIYPGMIELHNHLAYNIIPAWDVPKKFENRDQWRRHKDYTSKMTGPLRILGSLDGYLQAIVRYTECKLLFSGVTSSQGITLAAAPGIRSLFKGLVRNVESTLDPDLKPAKTKIADVDKAEQLMKQLDKGKPYILHLAEGIPESANKHFRALKFKNSNKWAINENLAGIHAVGLMPDDYKTYARYKGSIVWSPLSNLLLYNKTTDISLVKRESIRMSIGSDWSPSGSKNLLNELKVAKLICEARNNLYSDEELVRMVTTEPAKIMKWYDKVGSLESGKKADIIVIKGTTDDPYDQFIKCREKSINWVLVGGMPRFGITRLMEKFTGRHELMRINKLKRKLNLNISHQQNAIDLDVGYKEAKKKLASGLRRLPSLARKVENSSNAFALGAADNNTTSLSTGGTWIIEHDHKDHVGSCGRHHIDYENEATTTEVYNATLELGASPLSERVEKMLLDESTVEEDKLYFKRLATQLNLDEYLKIGLPVYYNRTIQLNQVQEYKLEISNKEKASFNYVTTLESFLTNPGSLTINDKIKIVEFAQTILDKAYVHLKQKNALYAVNPMEKLRILKSEILESEDGVTELVFHRKMIEIFTSLRDLHTLYVLPEPFASKVAYLPFYIEQYYEGSEKKFIVSKIIGKKTFGQFKEGIEVTHWNGVAIEKAILENGQNYAGSNSIAQFARGLDSLTFRPLAVMLPPLSDWVTVTYRTSKLKKFSKKFQWKVGSHFDLKNLKRNENLTVDKLGLADGYDYLSDLVQSTKKLFFAKKTIKSTAVGSTSKVLKSGKRFYHNDFPFLAERFKKNKTAIGYIRIFNFNNSDHEAMSMAFKKLISELDTKHLIIDIRNNPGGNIYAAECMLQVLSKRKLEPHPAQFLNSSLSHHICDYHSPSSLFKGLDLGKWNTTLKSIRSTGAEYSVAYPITPPKLMSKYVSDSDFKTVLITDALCYSASDIFASGFQDNNLGKILGVDKKTGAGGANVWSLSTIYHLSKNDQGSSEFVDILPHGADIKVAVRRIMRTGAQNGIPLEDLGVEPDAMHYLTKKDLLESNSDLAETAMNLVLTIE